MFQLVRTALALGLCLSLAAASVAVAAGTAPAEPRLALHVDVLRIAADARAQRRTATAPEPCSDRSYNLSGARWRTAYRWYFRARSTPRGLSRNAAEAVIRRSLDNVTNARNDCGRADRVAARARYLGRTRAAPSCRRTDGRNVIGFRSFSDDAIAARACWWMSGRRIVEADVQINADLDWATSPSGCLNRLMLEAVMTHEAGHVFGLAHVGERRHGRLTMSRFIDGPCNNQEASLGLGDLRGLEALYP